jgi:tripartite-type tricarboxylate transporter receptor subunit TctC
MKYLSARRGPEPVSAMDMSRRRFLRAVAGAAALAVPSPNAFAQTYPTRPVRIVVGFGPGSPADILARLIGQWLAERLAQPFIVENRPGAGGNLATEFVARAPADGYTLLLSALSDAVNAALYEKLNFDFIRDIAPIAGLIRQPEIMVVNPSVPAKTIPEFIAYAKANAGKINMGSAGVGTAPHLAGELFKIMAGVDMLHVPYRGGGGAAITALLSGQIQILFISPLVSIEHVKAEKLRALGVTTAARWDTLPDLPAVGEFVPGYEMSAWFGVGAPKNTPAEVVHKLNSEINVGMTDARMKAQIANLGAMPFRGPPADFARLIAEDAERWAKVVRTAKIKAE